MTYKQFLTELNGVLSQQIDAAQLSGGFRRGNGHFLQYSNFDHFTSDERQTDYVRLGVYIKNLQNRGSDLLRYISYRLPPPQGGTIGAYTCTFAGESKRDLEFKVDNNATVTFKVGKGRNDNGGSRKICEVVLEIPWGQREHLSDEDRNVIATFYRDIIMSVMPGPEDQNRVTLLGQPCRQNGQGAQVAENDGYQQEKEVAGINKCTADRFSAWLKEKSRASDNVVEQYIGYIRRHIAQGRDLSALNEDGSVVNNLNGLIADLEDNYTQWDVFSRTINGAENSLDQYKVALNKYLGFIKGLRSNIVPQGIRTSQKETDMADNNVTHKLNRIVFGAPGTGKSYRLDKEAKESFTDVNSERVTFYATYSYAQFVGTYKPVMKGEGVNEKITYQFVPGPFLRTLVKALNRPDENFLLIIEEINRANAAAVFGDVFQLLDRGVDGVSEYSIAASEDVKKYLEKVLTEGGKQALVKLSGSEDKLKIPANLYLWATMNSADQGVFPLDTAFKRRWSFEYIGIDEGESQAPDMKILNYDWKKLRKFLNRLLVLNGVNEDKLMGPFFLKDATEFDSKVLMYLWEDAARMCRRAVFGEIKTYSDLCDKWKEKGVEIFDGVKSDDTKLKGFRASLQPGDNQTTNDGSAPAQETNNG